MQAACQAFSLDERPVRDWHRAAGLHCQRLHTHMIEASTIDLKQVQADELRIRAQGQILSMALALCLTTRLWLGGLVSKTRDKTMARALALKVRACALSRPLLIVFDGFVAYIDAFRKAFRSPLHTGKRGRPRLVESPSVILGRVIKHRSGHRLETVERRLVEASSRLMRPGHAAPEPARAACLLIESQGGGTLNTAYIERLNATFRSVMAAGLTDHCWSVRELLNYRFTAHRHDHG